MSIFIFGGIFAFIAVSTGEGAEKIDESLKRNHDLIHEHEETAETFALLSYILALFSAVALWFNWKKHPFKDIAIIIVLFVGITVVSLSYSTGQTGGEITHPEVRHEFKKPSVENGEKEE